MTNNLNNQKLDPDPFMIASLGMATICAIGSLVSIYKSFGADTQPAFNNGNRSSERQQLDYLETHIGNFKMSFKRVTKVIERGSDDSDREFYSAPMRLAQTELMLSNEDLQAFSQSFGSLSVELSCIYNWIVNVKITNPDLAYRLGKRIGRDIDEVALDINKALKDGADMRIFIAGLRRTLEAFEAAILEESRSN